MNQEVIILITEDEDGHALLIRKNLKRSGIHNKTIRFRNGQEILDFLFCQGEGPHMEEGNHYLLLLDIRMPKIDGIEVLRQVKEDPELYKIPIAMLTTTDDPREVEKCHEYGCNYYITKPLDHDKFVKVILQMGLFFKIISIPVIVQD